MITSTVNPKIKHVILLRNKAKVRKEERAYIVEGYRMCKEVPVSSILEVYMTQKFYDEHGVNDFAHVSKYKIEIVSEEVMTKMSDTVTPQGVLMVVSYVLWDGETLLEGNESFTLFLENIQDPGNLGTLIRTAEAAGVSGVIMSKTTVDMYNPKVIRSTMGSIFRVKCAYVDDLPRFIKKSKVRVYAAALEGAKEYTAVDYKGAIGILIGNEGNGLSEEAVQAATASVFIPMAGEVESLNASISGAVLLYEAARQRRG